jgi:hypothetical protein
LIARESSLHAIATGLRVLSVSPYFGERPGTVSGYATRFAAAERPRPTVKNATPSRLLPPAGPGPAAASAAARRQGALAPCDPVAHGLLVAVAVQQRSFDDDLARQALARLFDARHSSDVIGRMKLEDYLRYPMDRTTRMPDRSERPLLLSVAWTASRRPSRFN